MRFHHPMTKRYLLMAASFLGVASSLGLVKLGMQQQQLEERYANALKILEQEKKQLVRDKIAFDNSVKIALHKTVIKLSKMGAMATPTVVTTMHIPGIKLAESMGQDKSAAAMKLLDDGRAAVEELNRIMRASQDQSTPEGKFFRSTLQSTPEYKAYQNQVNRVKRAQQLVDQLASKL